MFNLISFLIRGVITQPPSTPALTTELDSDTRNGCFCFLHIVKEIICPKPFYVLFFAFYIPQTSLGSVHDAQLGTSCPWPGYPAGNVVLQDPFTLYEMRRSVCMRHGKVVKNEMQSDICCLSPCSAGRGEISPTVVIKL